MREWFGLVNLTTGETERNKGATGRGQGGGFAQSDLHAKRGSSQLISTGTARASESGGWGASWRRGARACTLTVRPCDSALHQAQPH